MTLRRNKIPLIMAVTSRYFTFGLKGDSRSLRFSGKLRWLKSCAIFSVLLRIKTGEILVEIEFPIFFLYSAVQISKFNS